MMAESSYLALVAGPWEGAAALRAKCPTLTDLRDWGVAAILPLLAQAPEARAADVLMLWRPPAMDASAAADFITAQAGPAVFACALD